MRPLFLLWGCLVLPGYGALVGPKEISGFEGETVSLSCTYGDEQKKLQKYWCRESGILFSRCSGTIYAETDGREKTVGKVSIQDSRPERAIKVTLRGISQQDAGQYWCGIHKLGFDDTALVSLLVFPGRRAGGGDGEKRVRQRGKGTRPEKGQSKVGEQREACDPGKRGQPCRGPHPKGAEGQTESLEASADPHPTVSIVKTGFQATPHAGGSPHGHEGASLFPGASPPAGTSPHTHAATSPPAGTSRPTARLDPPSSEDPSLVSRSSSSKPRMVVPTARMLAPVLVLLALLLATGLAALGRCMIHRRKEAELEDSPKDKGEKMHLSHTTLGNNQGPECTIIDLAGPTVPDSSPLPSTEGQPRNQTSEEEQASLLELQGDPVPECPLPVPAEESGFIPV